MRNVHGVGVFGLDVDPQTRCRHWHSPADVIAIRFACCGMWYPCHDCHSAVADHVATVWRRDAFDTHAVLCGVCGHQLTVHEYLASGSTCTRCGVGFNPGCALHYHLYFER